MNYRKNYMKKTIKKLITHNGSFHADDVFACATLCIYLEKNKEKFTIIRTRNEKIIENGDYVFDIGGIYNPRLNKFDHHQKEKAGKRENGIEYSSFGLVWKKFGKKLSGSDKVARLIDLELVMPVDAYDNGFDLVKKKHENFPYLIQDVFRIMRPTWAETSLSNDKMFLRSVKIAKEILLREIIQNKDLVLAEKNIISIYKKTKDKRIIVLNKDYPYETILNHFPEPLFVIYPKTSGTFWGVKTLKEDIKEFKSKKDLPLAWAGLQDEDFQKVTGVRDVVFCHRGRFLAVAKTKAGAIKLAQIAVES